MPRLCGLDPKLGDTLGNEMQDMLGLIEQHERFEAILKMEAPELWRRLMVLASSYALSHTDSLPENCAADFMMGAVLALWLVDTHANALPGQVTV